MKFNFMKENYTLVFTFEDCEWREKGHSIPKYSDILLSDYLVEIGLNVPDYTRYLEILSDDLYIIYRVYDNFRITIHYQKK